MNKELNIDEPRMCTSIYSFDLFSACKKCLTNPFVPRVVNITNHYEPRFGLCFLFLILLSSFCT